jgi:hypothetical protein
MRKPRSAFLFFVLLVLGLSLAVPGEDVPETAFDESEAASYESTPLFSTPISQVAVPATGAVRSAVRPRSSPPFRSAVTRITDTESRRSAEARVALALLCTLLC